MFSRAAWLVPWAMLAAVAGCRENVYLGDPIDLQDHVVPEGGIPESGIRDSLPPLDGPPFPWYLDTWGSKILDSNDGIVALRGINWAGMQGPLRVPDGLHARTVEDFMQQIEDLHFNLIRVPVSSDSLQPSSMPTTPISMVDPLRANPDLAGSNMLDALDSVITVAFRHPIRGTADPYPSPPTALAPPL